jgi:hypothetical protein
MTLRTGRRPQRDIHPSLPGLGRGPGDQAVPEWVGEHFEQFVAGGERPAIRVLDQRERLSMLIEVNPGGAGCLDVPLDDDGPIADRDILQPDEGVHARPHPSERAEIAEHLFLQGGSYTGQL